VSSSSSILARLKNESIKRQLSNQQMIVLFLHEEFSRRLGKSKYKNQLILKGGFLLFSLGAGDARATMDSDYLVEKISTKNEIIEEVIKEIIRVDNDIINLEYKNITTINNQNKNHGFRVKLIGKIGRTKTPIFIDLGVGDTVVPKPNFVTFETIIDGFEKPEIRAYSMETIVAEKLDAILYLMEASSRMKDYYDIYYLGKTRNFDGEILKEAIYTTFENRGHLHLINNIHEINRFKEIVRLKNMWKRFIQNEIRTRIEFDKVIDTILEFSVPVCEAIENNEDFNKKWNHKDKNYQNSN